MSIVEGVTNTSYSSKFPPPETGKYPNNKFTYISKICLEGRCVLVHIRIKGEVDPLNMFKRSSDFLPTVLRWCYFVDPFWNVCMFHGCLFITISSVPCSPVITYWERSDLLALLCHVFLCSITFPYGVSGRVCNLIVLIPDLCFPLYFDCCFTSAGFSYNVFQWQLSRIEFTLNYPPIKNNLTL